MTSQEKLSDFLVYIGSAISNCSLYSPEHAAVEAFCRRAALLLEDLFEKDSFSLHMLADSLLFNDLPVTDKSEHISRFTRKLRLKGIEKVVIKKGVTLGELKNFVIELAVMDKAVSSSAHIAVGTLELRYSSDGDFSCVMEENVAKVNEVYEGVSRFRRLDIRGVEDVVGSFLAAMKREANVLRQLSPVKSHSTYTYVHETNVSLLTIFQAEAIGLTGEALHDAGLAGLLHDVGKLFIPREVIEKKEQLSKDEWNMMTLHPVYGASYLGALSDVSKVTVIVAYEHHLKYNLSGYPKTKSKTRKQHLISQLVAISDVYDALRTKRSYRSAIEIPAILDILKEGAGRDFNPLLIDNFMAACKKVKAL